jgi:hypothetical protein
MSPILKAVTVSYLNQNLPPEIHSLTIANGSEKMTLEGTPIATSGFAETGSPMGTISSPMGAVGIYGSPSGSETDAGGKPPITINWQASDPNRDELVYNLYIKSAQEQEWHLLRGKLKGDMFSLQPDALSNGQYQVRLVASDAPSNPPNQALKTELVSAPFWVDNTPPEVEVTRKDVSSHDAVVDFEAKSEGAPLRKAEVSIGENTWHPIVSDDGIVDSHQEMFTVKLSNLSPGEHVISLRAVDTAGNIGVGAAVIWVK